ncbi:MAG: hypothetical protein EZS28_022963 [Streblomastix strix]|uniref:C2 domain-containing protein n=1 Tax=Streblomastix strix TaxID=222440 RepID=A0A5J4VG17_9EUKA|nr:MAG: hypothetical protein EZS28_022963 [Streblomastix strix]
MSRKIQVTILEGRHLNIAKDFHVTDPFVLLKLGYQRQTSHGRRGINPKWNESFIFTLNDKTAPILDVQVRSQDRIKLQQSICIGQDSVNIQPYLDRLPVSLNLNTDFGYITIMISEAPEQIFEGSYNRYSKRVTKQGVPFYW